jgi:hypothetical protein
VTRSERAAYVAEFERRFRERTPSTDILSALPECRVGRSEMQAWAEECFGRKLVLDDYVELEAPIKRLLARLRKEFPEERW